MTMRANTPDSFWSHLDKSSSPKGCWLWLLGRDRGGYGKTKHQGRSWRSHRLAWSLRNGPIPEGLQVNHSCDVRLCCNPAHLTVGTQKDNIKEAVSRGRMASGDRQGLRKNPASAPRGERNGSAKLTADQALSIRRSSSPVLQLASEFGVSKATVRFIKSRRIWKHI